MWLVDLFENQERKKRGEKRGTLSLIGAGDFLAGPRAEVPAVEPSLFAADWEARLQI